GIRKELYTPIIMNTIIKSTVNLELMNPLAIFPASPSFIVPFFRLLNGYFSSIEQLAFGRIDIGFSLRQTGQYLYLISVGFAQTQPTQKGHIVLTQGIDAAQLAFLDQG